MRRRIDIQPKSLFQGREFARLMTLLVMLCLIGMLMLRAKDPNTWAMFERSAEEQKRAEDLVRSPTTSAVSASNSTAVGPKGAMSIPSADSTHPKQSDVISLDEDPEEQDSLKEELGAVTDKEALQAIEMPAYYRLLRWVRSQPVDKLQQKAQYNLPFRELFERPNAYRGKLIDIRLKVRRVLQHSELEKDNPAGISSVWELIGYNDSSGINFYTCVTPTVPSKMTVGESVTEDGRFVGYFLKLQAYEDRQGKNRATPLLIGRFIWDPPVLQKADPEQQRRELIWGLIAIGVLGTALLARWGMRRLWPPSKRATVDIGLQEIRRRRSLRSDSDEQNVDIETWLSQAEPASPDSAIFPPNSHEPKED